MRRLILSVLILAGLALGPGLRHSWAGNVTLNFFPSFPLVQALQPVTVGISISGVSTLANPGLGAFDLFLGYNPAVLSFSQVNFTPALGGSLASIQTVNHPSPGQLEVAEVSTIVIPAVLEALQGDTFGLAYVTFTGASSIVGQVNTTITMPQNQILLSDAVGNPITGFTITSVPEPSGLLLVLGGMLGLASYRIKRQKRR